jgi:hypothetical protein
MLRISVTQRYSTAAETAANFRAAYEARMARRDKGRPWRCHRDKAVDLAYLRERVLVKVGRLTPKWPSQLRQEVEEDLGSVCERRFARCLKWLLEQGEIKRTSDGYLLVYRRPR